MLGEGDVVVEGAFAEGVQDEANDLPDVDARGWLEINKQDRDRHLYGVTSHVPDSGIDEVHEDRGPA